MKQCKVYSSEKKNETAGIIVEGHVLLPASRHEDVEICYFAMVMAKTPRNGFDSIGDGWDAVPEDIREDVRWYMANNGMEQPETVRDIQ